MQLLTVLSSQGAAECPISIRRGVDHERVGCADTWRFYKDNLYKIIKANKIIDYKSFQ